MLIDVSLSLVFFLALSSLLSTIVSLPSINFSSRYRFLVPVMGATKPPNALAIGSRDRDRFFGRSFFEIS